MASISKRPNGRYRARYRDVDGREHARHFERRKDAERWLAGQVTKVADGTWVDPAAGRLTFDEFADGWIEAQLQHRPSTRAMTKSRLDRHLRPTFGRMALADIQRAHVRAWVAELVRAGLAPSTVEGLYRLLAQVMLAAVEDQYLQHSPCRRIQLPERPPSRIVVPTVDQVAAVMAHAPSRGRALVATAAGTGMRVSELCGLTVDRLELLRRQVVVDRQLLGANAGEARFGPPKTKASVRTIPIPETLADALGAHLAEHLSPGGFVFTTEAGGPWVRKSVANEWRRWSKAAGVGFRFHELRHFYASALIAAGQSVKVVQARLGHATAAMTLDIYGHLWPDDEDRTRGIVAGLLEGVLSPPAEPLQLPSPG